MILTKDSSKYIGKEAVGYMVNCKVSPEITQKIKTIQHMLELQFGSAIWCQPLESLHITLLDWLAPLVVYEKDKDVLFNEIYPNYDEVLSHLLSEQSEIRVKFSDINVSQGAVFAVGVDNGMFENIRNEFIKKIHLLEGTKQPPSIIHFTIARFVSELPIDDVVECINNSHFNDLLVVDNFRLIRETTVPMIAFETIKNYPLKTNYELRYD